jgi:hypothetical protein
MKDPPIGRGGSAAMAVHVWDRIPSAVRRMGRRDRGWGVALNAHGGKIYGALSFYARRFFKITFRKGNITMNPLLVLMIAVMILLVYLKRHGGW